VVVGSGAAGAGGLGSAGARKTTGSGVVLRREDREEREREMDEQGINLEERRRKNNRSKV
jgi:hypothetical protein